MREATRSARRWTLYAALAALYLLHNDLWLWDDARLVLGLPAGLLYHVAFCLVTAAVLLLVVKYAWPRFDDDDTPDDAGAGSEPARESTGPSSGPTGGSPRQAASATRGLDR